MEKEYYFTLTLVKNWNKICEEFKMKKLAIILSILSVSGLLVACGSTTKSSKTQNSSSTTSTKSSSTSKVKSSRSSASSTSIKQNTTLWDTNKDKQLQEFISSWQGKMGQSYTKYDGTNSLETSTGTKYPDIFNGNGIYMGDTKISIGWSTNGESPYDYNVVAIYNYDGTKPPLPNHITYLFAFHNGQPIALVDQSREGNVTVKETSNNDVKEAFEKIATGSGETTQSSTASSASSTTSEPSFNELAVATYSLAYGDGSLNGAKIAADSGFLELYYLEDTQHYGIGQGTSTSTITLKQDGDNIIYWTKDRSNGKTTAEADLIKHTISIKELKEKYFKTTAQQQEISEIAGKLKTGTTTSN